MGNLQAGRNRLSGYTLLLGALLCPLSFAATPVLAQSVAFETQARVDAAIRELGPIRLSV
jgi:hypothetical protein